MHVLKPFVIQLFCLCVYIQSLPAAFAAPQIHPHDEAHVEKTHSERTIISADAAKAANIETEIAGPALINEYIKLTGQILLNQNRSVDVKARFPGVVNELYVNVGDEIQKDQPLIKIESNGTLEHYTINAPQAGTIITRNTNIGDLSLEKPLLIISDLSTLWAKFHVFPQDINKIKKNDPVIVKSLDDKQSTATHISFISPMVDSISQSVFAIAELPNNEKLWRPGTVIKGNVLVLKQEVALAVKIEALQKMEDATVVFVKVGDQYEAKALELGKRDDEWVEVISGIEPGTRYVTKNSFIIKADIGKHGAAHEH